MYRSPVLVASFFAGLMLAGSVVAQRFDEIPPAAGGTVQRASASASLAQPAQPAQPVQPPGVQPPAGVISFTAPAAGQGAAGGTFVVQGGGRGRAVISAPAPHPGGGGFGHVTVGHPPMMYGFGMDAGADDPDMAKPVQLEHELDRQSHDLIRKYADTEDQQVREKAKVALREMLNKQFDLQNERREMELKRVEERLAKLRDQLKKRSDSRTQIIDQRLTQLVNEAEGLGWTSPGGAGAPLNLQFAPGSSARSVPAPAIAR
jgi:hypothetical protein